ncbi:DnaJ C-terminal domain-containing protein [Sphingorhabdus sp. Alg231-15]|uniref:DnaJ C-terminal domain-containing protein n=1 Tax=Sphingorhabdus sp. Alg231-15 TaxID=1922222 RepID=UPI000D55D179
MVDPYQALGVAKGASEKEIKSAYRKLAKELHPDRNKDNPKATERFSDVTKAYDLLLDKDKRAQFDRGEIDAEGNPAGFGFGGGPGGAYSRGGGGQQFDFGNSGTDFGDIFEGLFGGGGGGGRSSGPFGSRQRSAPPPKGANVSYRLKVEFIAAATLEKQRITLEDGKTIDLSLPKGVEEGTQMRLGGKGRQGPGGNGDALVTIHINDHPFYERDGDNVTLELPISLKEAVEGAKIKVPTVDGPVMLSIPAGSDSGKTLRLKNKGFHKKSGGRGDHLVTLMITLPKDNNKLAEFVENWDNGENPRADMGV